MRIDIVVVLHYCHTQSEVENFTQTLEPLRETLRFGYIVAGVVRFMSQNIDGDKCLILNNIGRRRPHPALSMDPLPPLRSHFRLRYPPNYDGSSPLTVSAGL